MKGHLIIFVSSNGSIRCDYEVVFAATVNLTVVVKEMKNTPITVIGVHVDMEMAVEKMSQGSDK